MNEQKFWIRVRELIKTHNMNQEQFAAYIKVPVSTFQGWIYYKRIPDAITAFEMATALGVSVEYLVSGKDMDNTEIRLKELTARKAASRIDLLLGKIQTQTKALGLPL